MPNGKHEEKIVIGAEINAEPIKGLGRAFQWVNRQTDDLKRSIVGLNSLAERQNSVAETARRRKISTADAEKLVADTERKHLGDTQKGIQRITQMGKGVSQAARGGGVGGVIQGLAGGAGRGVSGIAARAGAGAAGMGIGAAALGATGVGALVGGGMLAARGFGMAKEQTAAYENLERRVKAVNVAFGDIQDAVKNVGTEMGFSRMEIVSTTDALTQFTELVSDVNQLANSVGLVGSMARGVGLRPEQLAGEIGQMQRFLGFSVTQDTGQTREMMLQMADVMGRTQMGGRAEEFIKATSQLSSVAADIMGVAPTQQIMALQATMGETGAQGLMGGRGADLIQRIHSAIAQPGGEQQFGFRFRALGQGRGQFQTMLRMQQGAFGPGNIPDILSQLVQEVGGGGIPTQERLLELQRGGFADVTEEEARVGVIAGQQLGIAAPRALEFLATMAPGGNVTDVQIDTMNDIKDQLAGLGKTFEQVAQTPQGLRMIFDVLRKGEKLTDENLKRVSELGKIADLKTTEEYLNNMNTTLGEKILPVVATMGRAINRVFGIGMGKPSKPISEMSAEELNNYLTGVETPKPVTKEEARQAMQTFNPLSGGSAQAMADMQRRVQLTEKEKEAQQRGSGGVAEGGLLGGFAQGMASPVVQINTTLEVAGDVLSSVVTSVKDIFGIASGEVAEAGTVGT